LSRRRRKRRWVRGAAPGTRHLYAVLLADLSIQVFCHGLYRMRRVRYLWAVCCLPMHVTWVMQCFYMNAPHERAHLSTPCIAVARCDVLLQVVMQHAVRPEHNISTPPVQTKVGGPPVEGCTTLIRWFLPARKHSLPATSTPLSPQRSPRRFCSSSMSTTPRSGARSC
jgi:hypothetical protein